MGFDAKKFSKTKFSPRTEDVPVPDLKEFFAEGEAPVWKIRGLTGQELGQANEAADRNKNMIAILAGLASRSEKEVTNSVKELLGVGGNTPDDVAKRIEHLVLGSVDPVCTQELAVRLCTVFPIEFFQITNKIYQITGQGQMPGKPKPSGAAATSDQALPSATPEGDSSTK